MGGVVLTELLLRSLGEIAKEWAEKVGVEEPTLTFNLLLSKTTNNETSLICYVFVTKMI